MMLISRDFVRFTNNAIRYVQRVDTLGMDNIKV